MKNSLTLFLIAMSISLSAQCLQNEMAQAQFFVNGNQITPFDMQASVGGDVEFPNFAGNIFNVDVGENVLFMEYLPASMNTAGELTVRLSFDTPITEAVVNSTFQPDITFDNGSVLITYPTMTEIPQGTITITLNGGCAEIPTMGQWSLLILGQLIACSGLIFIRRQSIQA